MIIEQVKVDGPKNIFLVHFDLNIDKRDHVENVTKWLSTIPDYAALPILNGQPAPSNPLPKITLFNADDPVLCSVVKKIAKFSKPGAFIALTEEEMKAWVNSKSTDWRQL